MHQPMQAIDLALQVREAFYQLSDQKLKALLSGKRDSSDDLFDLAWDVAPKIFPVREPQSIPRLTALAVDMPELMTREPETIQSLRFDYDILPLTPLRVLHANVVDLAVGFAKDEVTRFSHLKHLPGDSRHVFNMMQKHYVLKGFVNQGSVSIAEVLRAVFGNLDWHFERNARAVLAPLLTEEFAEQRDCIDESYALTLFERSALIERYHLDTKWPKPEAPFDEVADVRQLLLEIEQANEEKSI